MYIWFDYIYVLRTFYSVVLSILTKIFLNLENVVWPRQKFFFFFFF